MLDARESIEATACFIQRQVGCEVSKKHLPNLRSVQTALGKIQGQINTLYLMKGELAMLEEIDEESD